MASGHSAPDSPLSPYPWMESSMSLVSVMLMIYDQLSVLILPGLGFLSSSTSPPVPSCLMQLLSNLSPWKTFWWLGLFQLLPIYMKGLNKVDSISVQLSPLRPTFHSLVRPSGQQPPLLRLAQSYALRQDFYGPIIHCTKVRVSIDVDARGTPRVWCLGWLFPPESRSYVLEEITLFFFRCHQTSLLTTPQLKTWMSPDEPISSSFK